MVVAAVAALAVVRNAGAIAHSPIHPRSKMTQQRMKHSSLNGGDGDDGGKDGSGGPLGGRGTLKAAGDGEGHGSCRSEPRAQGPCPLPRPPSGKETRLQ